MAPLDQLMGQQAVLWALLALVQAGPMALAAGREPPPMRHPDYTGWHSHMQPPEEPWDDWFDDMDAYCPYCHATLARHKPDCPEWVIDQQLRDGPPDERPD